MEDYSGNLSLGAGVVTPTYMVDAPPADRRDDSGIEPTTSKRGDLVTSGASGHRGSRKDTAGRGGAEGQIDRLWARIPEARATGLQQQRALPWLFALMSPGPLWPPAREYTITTPAKDEASRHPARGDGEQRPATSRAERRRLPRPSVGAFALPRSSLSPCRRAR